MKRRHALIMPPNSKIYNLHGRFKAFPKSVKKIYGLSKKCEHHIMKALSYENHKIVAQYKPQFNTLGSREGYLRQ